MDGATIWIGLGFRARDRAGHEEHLALAHSFPLYCAFREGAGEDGGGDVDRMDGSLERARNAADDHDHRAEDEDEEDERYDGERFHERLEVGCGD